MRFVSAILALFIVAAKRLWHQRLLMLCLLVGLVAAVGLLSSIPLYADAVHNRLLQGELTEAGTYRPPFAFLWRYIGAWHGEIAWDEYAQVDRYLTRQATGAVGLPEEMGVRHVSSPKLRLFPAESAAFADDAPLLWSAVGFVSGLEEKIQVVEGAYPDGEAPGASPGEAAPVLISQVMADQLGLQVGEHYTLFGSGRDAVQIPVQVSGVWRPADETSPFWFYEPDAFDEMLLTDEALFEQHVVPALEAPVDTAVWYQIYDGSRVRPATVSGLLDGVATVEARVSALLNNTTLDVSPVGNLQDYGQSSGELSVILTIFSVPIVGLILYFIVLIAGMVVQREQSEIAILRSRGMTRGQIVAVYLLEGLLVGALGLAGGLFLGQWLAGMMGRTQSFLDLASPSVTAGSLVTVISGDAVLYGLLAITLATLALLLPGLAASRHTIISLRWEQARTLIRPFWQRYYLDVLLLIPPIYGWYQLSRQGSVAALGSGEDPFSNPLLFLVPILFCFSLGLLLMRFFPLIMGGLASLAARLPFTTPLMTLRQLARSAGLYSGPLLLLCLTVSLAFFTASMALTLDRHMWDRVYYQIGADLNLAELGESTEESEQGGSLPGQQQAEATAGEEEEEGPRWLFLPVTDHLQVAGVESAARVGEYSATANIGGRQQAGRLTAIDRYDFGQVGFFRPDFALDESLGGILNRLAIHRSNILVDRRFLVTNGLTVGDPLRLTVGAAGDVAPIEFVVAGALDLFPTHYPQDGPFFVANLDHVHEGLGGTYPYSVWLTTDPGTDGQDIVQDVREQGFAVVTAQDSREMIASEQGRPERQGLFGLLSVGFMAAAALTVLGFLVYAVVSFQRRFIELGMLRAIGLSVGQMSAYLAGEQAVLILTGLGIGTALGFVASVLFIPYFQVGSDKTALVPPFVVQVAWGQLGTIYAIFGVMFVAAVVVLSILMIRMKIFEAVKLGEAV
ncbi:MAG: ABC transporter permease [Chloroflexota bacterium]|nr:MAG: ABC transporter permease [Chloroflexota bacterium]